MLAELFFLRLENKIRALTDVTETAGNRFVLLSRQDLARLRERKSGPSKDRRGGDTKGG
jgi:hypothetical protein